MPQPAAAVTLQRPLTLTTKPQSQSPFPVNHHPLHSPHCHRRRHGRRVPGIQPPPLPGRLRHRPHLRLPPPPHSRHLLPPLLSSPPLPPPAPPAPSPPAVSPQTAVDYASPAPSPPAVPPHTAIDYASPDPPPPPSPPAAAEPSNAFPEPYACWRAAEEEVTSWRDSDGDVAREWRRAANYLFGYSEGYGERWAGTDSYGIPIYANKTYGDEPLVVEVEPAREARLEWHGSHVRELDVVPYSERCDGLEKPGYREWWAATDTYEIPVYANKRYGDEPLVVEVEPVREARLEWYQGQGRELDVVPYVNSGRWDEVEKPVEANSGYGEVYGERLDPCRDWCSSYEERLDTTSYYGVPEYGYNRHYGEEALTVQLQTHEVAMSLKPGYSEEYTASEANWHFSSNGEQDYDRHHAFGSRTDTYGTHNHEQALSVQLEPFKPSWSQNPLYFGTYRDEVSSKSHQNDDPYHETAAQFFCPFQKYSDYE